MPKVIVNLQDNLVGLTEAGLMLDPNEWREVRTSDAEHPQVQEFKHRRILDVLTLGEAAKRKAEMAAEEAKAKAEIATKEAEDAQALAEARKNEAEAAVTEYEKLSGKGKKTEEPSDPTIDVEKANKLRAEALAEEYGVDAGAVADAIAMHGYDAVKADLEEYEAQAAKDAGPGNGPKAEEPIVADADIPSAMKEFIDEAEKSEKKDEPKSEEKPTEEEKKAEDPKKDEDEEKNEDEPKAEEEPVEEEKSSSSKSSKSSKKKGKRKSKK